MWNLPAQVPEKWHEVLILPVLFTIFALLIWFPGRSAQFKHGVTWKWWALGPLLIALYSGSQYFMYMRDAVYAEMVSVYGRKLTYAHYMSFVFPVLVLVGLLVWNKFDKRLIAQDNL